MRVSRGYFAVHLSNPRDHNNVGCALRACGAFEAAYLSYAGRRYQKHQSDTQKAYRHMPLIHLGAELGELGIPYDCVPVAVEVVDCAVPLQHYTHPERALYVFGPEDGSIPPEVMRQCRDVVRIPSVFCLNLAAAVNVVLYDRTAKQTANRTPYANGRPSEAHP
jgi:tRNA(Leu) C34 or U34 (ribose-2'-O)-methylase TrmL